ncbi:scarecrow-like protein 18 [Malania oleifera]|uniref:scarecrow-like protein 18 n=1 Tax=Malania oleifera TaxID=397392 RepID=UPI0025AE4C52|nr:scarecrow-like protein 18 [Malania oleifera]
MNMMSSFSSSREEEEDSSDPQCQQLVPQPSRGFIGTGASAANAIRMNMRQLLISCAELVSQSDFRAAYHLLSLISANSSPSGDSTQRLVHQFAAALSLRLKRMIRPAAAHAGGGHHHLSSFMMTNIKNSSINKNKNINNNYSITNIVATAAASGGGASSSCVAEYYCSSSPETLQSSYLSLNQITPFVRFSQLTANQAILEATEGQQAIHIIDFDILHGVQWPPLMQAIADRHRTSLPESCNHDHPRPPTPMLRITGTGQDLELLRRTGDRLLKFAQSVGLNFQFHILLLNHDDDPAAAASMAGAEDDDLISCLPSALALLPDEVLAVNCGFYLHRLLRDDNRLISLFLQKIKAMKPKVVTVAEREANHNQPVFLERFVEAVDHYTAIFDSLEATVPPNSRERLAVERIWFGKEIVDIVAAEGDQRRERHQRLESWQAMLRGSGFSNVPWSGFALSQAKLLLRLHYPSEGYHLQSLNDSALFLGWRNQPLFSVSSWH